ncbi:MAG: DNA methyltransferase [Anaerolineaceae bacterium]|nr:DNA methyltransferase [Anaerolineaceae bacterium]
MAEPNFKNQTVWIGDNLPVLRGINSECVDLIYLDPPFNSNRDHEAPIGSQEAMIAFKDTWTLNDIDLHEHGELAERHEGAYKVIDTARATHGKSAMSYLIMMSVRLLEMHRILKPTGAIYLHCDKHMSHYLKLLMDAIFGQSNFRSEVIWQRASKRAKGSQHAPKTFGVDTDSIFFYAKSPRHKMRDVYRKLNKEEELEKFPEVDRRGRYNTDVPIFRAPSMGERPNLCYEYKGIRSPHPSGWRVSKSKLIEMDERGEIIWREGKSPLRKSYLANYKGKPVGSLWLDIPNVGKKRIHVTEKPLKLLKRIILASSDEGDLVFDPFCGCATALVAADKEHRRWAGCDIAPKAATLVNERIREEQQPLFAGCNVLHDIPRRTDLDVLPNYRTHKHALYGMQEGVCKGCDVLFPFKIFQVDHIVPQSRGGTDHIENLQLLCPPCNSSKGSKTMAEWRAS